MNRTLGKVQTMIDGALKITKDPLGCCSICGSSGVHELVELINNKGDAWSGESAILQGAH
jgi:hypothetical protein